MDSSELQRWKYAGSNTLATVFNSDVQFIDGKFEPALQDTVYFDPNGSLVADLSDATAATINQLREAFQIQKLYERDARGGTRYIEIIRSHFGVISPDARLQRPDVS